MCDFSFGVLVVLFLLLGQSCLHLEITKTGVFFWGEVAM